MNRLYSDIIFVLLVTVLNQVAVAFPKEQLIQGLKGPWELAVNFGQDTQMLFPVEVPDENASQKLDKTFPVVGSPLQIKLLQYCPDLKWKTAIAYDPKGGPAACITVAAKDSSQQIYLLADIPERRSMIASVGGLAIRKLYNASDAQELAKLLSQAKKIGILTVWTDPNTLPQEFAVKAGDKFNISGTSYSAEILEYMPHYSIDKDTKQVLNYSDQPRNPALKIRLTANDKVHEHWLWSNFSMPPHGTSTMPLRIEFNDFDFGPLQNRFFIVTTAQGQWLYSPNEKLQECLIGRPYPFKDGGYTFSLDRILPHGNITAAWENESDSLEHPALVMSIQSDKASQEAVVEINKPARVNTEYGMLVLSYRQRTQKLSENPKAVLQ